MSDRITDIMTTLATAITRDVPGVTLADEIPAAIEVWPLGWMEYQGETAGVEPRIPGATTTVYTIGLFIVVPLEGNPKADAQVRHFPGRVRKMLERNPYLDGTLPSGRITSDDARGIDAAINETVARGVAIEITVTDIQPRST
jgi:hypothetical protein